LRRTVDIVGLGLLVALVTGDVASCGRAGKASIVLNVSTAPTVDRSAITALQVTVNGRVQSYDVGAASTWSLRGETSPGSKSIVVQGMATSPVTAPWQGVVNAVAGQVVCQDVELQALGTTPPDGGSGGASGADRAASDGPAGNGGSPGSGGAGGGLGSGGRSGPGGTPGTGGLPSSGGAQGTGGPPGTAQGTGGPPGTGAATRTSGAPGTGGIVGVGGTPGSGGTTGTCPAVTPLTGGTQYCSGAIGELGNGYTYQLWSNDGTPCMTVYGVDASFKVTWSNAGDFLAMVGLEFDATKTYDQIGTLSSDFAFTKTDSGGVTYIGIHGWTLNPRRELYIVEDWFGSRPAPGTSVGTIRVDAADYDVYTERVVATGAAGSENYYQFFSVRRTARQCGHISISEHFSQWVGLGLQLGMMADTKVLVEGMRNSGTVDFTTATIVVH
jgi:endo-1,4-beta-xylanase